MTRAAMALIAALAAAAVSFGVACDPCDLSRSPLLSAFSRWDGEAYLSIARDGYQYDPGERSNITFSPLLPLLMRLVAQLAGRTDDDALLTAGLVVVNVALVVGLADLVALGRREVGAAAARRAALYTLVFPTTVFLSAVYPESLFLALAVAAVYSSRRAQWWRAGALAALGVLARPFGILLTIPLAMEMATAREGRPSRGTAVAALALPVAAFAAWEIELYRVSGDPFVFLNAERVYGRTPSVPLGGLLDLLDPRVYGNPWLVVGILALTMVLLVLSWRMLRPSTAAYGTAIVLVTLASGTLTSFPRYALSFFPGMLVLGALGAHRPVHFAYLAVATVLSALLTAMFASWYWIG